MRAKQAMASTMHRNVAKKVTRNTNLQHGSYPMLIAIAKQKRAPRLAHVPGTKPTTHVVSWKRTPTRLVEPNPTTDGPMAFRRNEPGLTNGRWCAWPDSLE
jgi:hypothetical protein